MRFYATRGAGAKDTGSLQSNVWALIMLPSLPHPGPQSSQSKPLQDAAKVHIPQSHITAQDGDGGIQYEGDGDQIGAVSRTD